MSQGKTVKTVILASASPRRKALLAQIGLSVQVDPSAGEEAVPGGLEPREMALHLAAKKVSTVAPKHRDAIVIGADTLGVLNGRILGKPRGEEEARSMLAAMSGTCHAVITGFSIVDTGTGRTVSGTVETKVWFRTLTAAEIDAYVRTGEPLDKAGAYAIQGLGAVLVERIEGDYFNVVGLPLAAVAGALKELGVQVLPVSG